MRTITANAQELLSQNMGTEIMVVLEVSWVEGNNAYYSDQELTGARAKIIDMGGFDTSMKLEGASDTQELNVILDDTDGKIREIYNSNDIHKRPANVYLLHKGQPLSDKILVFKGELVTPIVWDETQRTVSFNILSKLYSKQVGFSMEEGDFPNIPDEAMGKAWPLVFGQVCHLPTVKVRSPRKGYLINGVGIHDFTLEPRICQAKKIQCPGQLWGTLEVMEREANNEWGSEDRKLMGPDFQCVNRRYGEFCKLQDLLNQQLEYEKNEFEVYNGVKFPQEEKVTISIDGALFYGTFSGNTFSVIWRKHPDYDEFNHVPCREVPDIQYDHYQQTIEYLEEQEAQWAYSGSGLLSIARHIYWWDPEETIAALKKQRAMTMNSIFKFEDGYDNCDAALELPTSASSGGPVESQEMYDNMEASSFFWAPASSEVYLETEAGLLNIVSLIPGTVDSVAAYKTAPNKTKYLTELPTNYYTVYETDYGGYEVVELSLNRKLSSYDEGWEDDIYVSFTSDVGPNACDIIEWLINKYTDLTVDSTSFAFVKPYLTNYPNNFYLTDRPDVYDLIQDIAYQSRCAVFIRNDIIYIKYLPLEPTSERTISKSDIISGTFTEFLSTTEDVYTTHNITWKKSGATVRDDQDKERKIILKYNVNKYGSVKESHNYSTYNIFDLVFKSATFWLIRKANSWKKVKFQLPVKHIDLDVGDCITLDVTQFGDSVKCIIENMNLDINNYTIDFTCWTPIRSGESEEYYWAWPSQKSQHQIWPLPGDTNGGGGYNFDVTPPIGHVLTGGAHVDDQLIISSGDLHPSDVDDILPTVTCDINEVWDFDEEEPEIEAKRLAKLANRRNTEDEVEPTMGSANLEMNDDEEARRKEEEEARGDGEADLTEDDLPELKEEGCYYVVRLTYITARGLGQALGEAQPGGPCGGPCSTEACGCPICYGDDDTEEHTFTDPVSAKGFAQAKYAERDKDVNLGWWCPGVRYLWHVNIFNGDFYEDDCLDYRNADNPDPSLPIALNRVQINPYV